MRRNDELPGMNQRKRMEPHPQYASESGEGAGLPPPSDEAIRRFFDYSTDKISVGGPAPRPESPPAATARPQPEKDGFGLRTRIKNLMSLSNRGKPSEPPKQSKPKVPSGDEKLRMEFVQALNELLAMPPELDISQQEAEKLLNRFMPMAQRIKRARRRTGNLSYNIQNAVGRSEADIIFNHKLFSRLEKRANGVPYSPEQEQQAGR